MTANKTSDSLVSVEDTLKQLFVVGVVVLLVLFLFSFFLKHIKIRSLCTIITVLTE